MGEKKCMRCKDIQQGGIPICDSCRMELKKFSVLTDFLNSFDGDKDDLIWLIKSEISDRQSFVIDKCRVIADVAKGIIYLEPQGGSIFAKEKVEEINKLYNALAIAKSQYGG